MHYSMFLHYVHHCTSRYHSIGPHNTLVCPLHLAFFVPILARESASVVTDGKYLPSGWFLAFSLLYSNTLFYF